MVDWVPWNEGTKNGGNVPKRQEKPSFEKQIYYDEGIVLKYINVPEFWLGSFSDNFFY